MEENPPTDFRKLFANMVARADEDIDLLKAALYISGMEYPDLDVDVYSKVLDDLAGEAGQRIAAAEDRRAIIERLSEFLFVDLGFRGNEEDYYDPKNSHLNEVLDRRKGIPITLSLVYIGVAGRLGMVFEGIGLPGHFVIRTGPPKEELYVDPFNGGKIMSRADCVRTVSELFHGRVEFQEEHLRAYTKKELLVRILTNLKHNYTRLEDYPRAISSADLIAVMEPSLGSNLRDMAALHYAAKEYRLAIRDLESYLEADPQAQDADQVRERIRAIWNTLANLN